MGLLSGKFSTDSRLPGDDVRGSGADWLTAFDADGRPRREFLDRLAAIRESLTADGRTLVQGALGWIWARSERTIPIPGFKTSRRSRRTRARSRTGRSPPTEAGGRRAARPLGSGHAPPTAGRQPARSLRGQPGLVADLLGRGGRAE